MLKKSASSVLASKASST